MHSAVLLDRDGILNVKRDDYVKSVNELEILPGMIEGLRLLREAGYLLVIITNQSAVNRGIISIQELEEIHSYLNNIINNNNCKIDGIYYCPHRPDEKCKCRKPEIGLIISAAKDLDIDLPSSWFVGDSESDVLAGLKAGCNCILTSGPNGLMRAANVIYSYKGNIPGTRQIIRI